MVTISIKRLVVSWFADKRVRSGMSVVDDLLDKLGFEKEYEGTKSEVK